MNDLGQPASYFTLEKGLPVYCAGGDKVGKVSHVLAEPELDIFDGLVLDTSILPGGHRFVDADQVEEVFERGVLLRCDRTATEALPQPSANPAALDADPADEEESELTRKLRRAWDLISGRS